MTPFELLVFALANFRLAYLISKEAGPFWLAKKLRSWVSRKTPKKSHMDEGIKCPYCSSLQTSLLLVGFYFLTPYLPVWAVTGFTYLMFVLAVSGAAIIFHQIFIKLQS